jgi:hypothetical protein
MSTGRGEVPREGALGDPERVRDPVVHEVATPAERVHRRPRHSEPLRGPPNGEVWLGQQAIGRLLDRVSKGVSKNPECPSGLVRCVRVGKVPRCSNFRLLRLAAARRGMPASPSGSRRPQVRILYRALQPGRINWTFPGTRPGSSCGPQKVGGGKTGTIPLTPPAPCSSAIAIASDAASAGGGSSGSFPSAARRSPS